MTHRTAALGVLFAMIVAFGDPGQPQQLIDKFLISMAEDFEHRVSWNISYIAIIATLWINTILTSIQ